MSIHGNDPVDSTTPVFTQAEVFMVGGYLAELWEIDDYDRSIADDVERAVQSVLGA